MKTPEWKTPWGSDLLLPYLLYTGIEKMLENVEFPRGGVSLNFNKEKKRKKNKLVKVVKRKAQKLLQ